MTERDIVHYYRGRWNCRNVHPAVAQQPQKLTVRTDFPVLGMHAGLILAVTEWFVQDAGLEVDVSDGAEVFFFAGHAASHRR